MPDPSSSDRTPGANLSGDEINVGGDVVGRDKITTTSHTTHNANTTVVNEGGPVARYAVLGLIGIAALAIVMLALFNTRPPVGPSTASATPSISPAASDTAPAPSPIIALTTAAPTPNASPTATATAAPPTASPTGTPSPTATETPTETFTPTPTLAPGITPTPTSALPVYDAFNDGCLDAGRWSLSAPPTGPETPTATPIPSQGNCLQADRQFFTEGRDGRLSVFLSLEDEQTYQLVQTPPGCFREAEVTLALDQVSVFADRHLAYLVVGVGLQRVTGDAALEVRVRGGNLNGPLLYDITSRLIVPRGYTDVAAQPYTPGQTITLAFRARDVGDTGPEGSASVNKRLSVYVNGQPLGQSLSVIADPCNLSIGYRAETQTALDGAFDEVRLLPAP